MPFLTNNFQTVLKYSIMFLGASAATEIVYKLYLRMITYNQDKKEINEVILCNNMSGCCRNRPRYPNTMSSPARRSKENLNEPPPPLAIIQPECKNPYCIGKNLERIVYFIDSAEKTIDLAMYIFTCHELAEAMFRAQKRGVKVRVVGDKSMAYSSGSQLLNFLRNGIPVKFQTDVNQEIMHHKFLLIDSTTISDNKADQKPQKVSAIIPKNGILMTGSMNWTMQALTMNWDNFLITSNKPLIDQYQTEFNTLWEAFGFKP